MTYIGIDPAFRKNGFVICIINEQSEVDFITFKDFTAFLDWVFTAPLAIYTVENSYLQDLTFDMRGSKPEGDRCPGGNHGAPQSTPSASASASVMSCNRSTRTETTFNVSRDAHRGIWMEGFHLSAGSPMNEARYPISSVSNSFPMAYCPSRQVSLTHRVIPTCHGQWRTRCFGRCRELSPHAAGCKARP